MKPAVPTPQLVWTLWMGHLGKTYKIFMEARQRKYLFTKKEQSPYSSELEISWQLLIGKVSLTLVLRFAYTETLNAGAA